MSRYHFVTASGRCCHHPLSDGASPASASILRTISTRRSRSSSSVRKAPWPQQPMSTLPKSIAWQASVPNTHPYVDNSHVRSMVMT